MFKNSRFYKFINKINPAIIFSVLLLISFVLSGNIIYGINNSSFVAQEKYVAKTKEEAGKDVHIRFSLGGESEASRLSLINPLNEYNAYRIKEGGRAVSYILKDDIAITYEENTYQINYAAYDDQWNDNELISHNRFVLSYGTYKDIAKENSVYLSTGLVNKISGLTAKEAVGKTIKLSLDETKEYTIAGIVRSNVANESGLHFASLFDDEFILFNSPCIYNYGFTDLLLTLDDAHFNEDFLDFIKAYNKSYLCFDKTRLTISSYDEENNHKVGYSLLPSYNVTANDKVASFLVILTFVLTIPLFLVILLFYDFNKVKLYYKIPAAILLTGYQFGLAFYLAEKVKKGLFMSNISMTMLTVFIVISLLSYIFAFILFNLNKKETKPEEDTNNG